MAVLNWVTAAVIAYAWLGTSKLDAIPGWAPMVGLIINALPAGMMGDLLKASALALIDKLPGRSAPK